MAGTLNFLLLPFEKLNLKGPSFVGFFDEENLIFYHPYKLGFSLVFSLILAQQVRDHS